MEKYLVFRFAIILMALGLAALYQMGLEPDHREVAFRLLYTLLGLYVVVGVASLGGVARWGNSRWYGPAQVSIDFGMSVLLTAITGGVVSVFCPLIFVSLFSACNVVRFQGALIFAALATLFLTITTVGCATGYIPSRYHGMHRALADHRFNFVLTYLVAVGIALHVVAILGSQVSTGLLRMQSLQREILESMGEGLVAIDADRRVLQLNGEARRLLDIDDRRGTLGETIDVVLADRRFQPIRRALETGDPRRFEVELEVATGSRRFLEVKVTDAVDERGKLRCRVALFADQALKREVEQAERRIHQLEELYEMSLGIAHEIRNPLASIRGSIQEIGRMQRDDANCARLVEIVCRESDRLDGIIEEFMCYTRKSPKPTSPIDLEPVLEETVILLENHPRYQSREVAFEATGGPYRVLGDREKIRQVVLNVGLNALAATDEEHGFVKVSLNRRQLYGESGGSCRDAVEILVEDNGKGIPEDHVHKIFTPFFTKREGGTGLGLAIVHRIVHDHGGTIQVRSREGRGTSVSILLPALVEQPGRGKDPGGADRNETESGRDRALQVAV